MNHIENYFLIRHKIRVKTAKVNYTKPSSARLQIKPTQIFIVHISYLHVEKSYFGSKVKRQIY